MFIHSFIHLTNLIKYTLHAGEYEVVGTEIHKRLLNSCINMNQALNVSFARRGMNAETDQISSCPQELYMYLQHRREVCAHKTS